jgi:pimeloyl-ACP methyl ester carboxylesterase
MRAQAKKSNNLPAIAELSQIKVPFENASQIYWHRHWLAIFTGNRPPNKIYVEQWATRWLSAFNEASAINFRTNTPPFGCPVYLFIGEKDYQTHFSIAHDYITSLKAEKKELFWFKNSGHNLNLTEPKKLQAIIISLTHN